jgi:hypothetical protein
MNSRLRKTTSTADLGSGLVHQLSDVIHRRRAVIMVAFVLTVVTFAAVGAFAPQTVSFSGPVGAFAALVGLALGLVAAGIGDATDARIFGARHVRGTGGELVATLAQQPSHAAVQQVLDALDRVRAGRIDPDTVLRVGIADASATTHHAALWTSALAAAAARRGERVLEVALATDATNGLGVCDVVRDNVPLSQAAQRVSQDLPHARLNAGPNRVQALEALPELTATLPRNLDTYLVGLPLAASRPVVTAVARLDVVLVLAEYAHTTRVELIAGLDAIEAVGVMTQVLLLQPKTEATDSDGADSDQTFDVLLPAVPAADAPTATTDVAAPFDTPDNPTVDVDATQRIVTAPRVGRVHDDEEQALLWQTAQQARYSERSTIPDEDGASQR